MSRRSSWSFATLRNPLRAMRLDDQDFQLVATTEALPAGIVHAGIALSQQRYRGPTSSLFNTRLYTRLAGFNGADVIGDHAGGTVRFDMEPGTRSIKDRCAGINPGGTIRHETEAT